MSEAGRVYCDYNAAAPMRGAARAALLEIIGETGNPSSIHADGRRLRARLEAAREDLAGCLGARAEDVVFASGATEALHLALAGALNADPARDLIVFAAEHDASFAQARLLRPEAAIAPCGADGCIDLGALEGLLARAARPLVAVQAANNETGVVQPVRAVAALVREAGGALLVDAAQAFGRIGLDMSTLDAAYLCVSGVKIGAGAGCGALALAPGAPFAPPRLGGGQERGRRPGTENVAACAALAAAALEACAEREAEMARAGALRDAFEARVKSLAPHAVFFGVHAQRLANTSALALPGLSAERALIALDLAGVSASSGAACSSGKPGRSRALAAMGVAEDLARCALRFSFGWASGDDDAMRAAAALLRLAARAEAHA